MQQFTVPQFLDVEDKIIGPITARQFIIMLSGFALIALCYRIFDFALFLFLGILIFAVSGVISFFKINGMPFHFFILNFTQTLSRPGLRVWNNAILNLNIRLEDEKIKIKEEMIPTKVKAHASRLAELSLIVDTRGAYKGKDIDNSAVNKFEQVMKSQN